MRHFGERGIVEDNIGGKIMFPRDFRAPSAQSLKAALSVAV